MDDFDIAAGWLADIAVNLGILFFRLFCMSLAVIAAIFVPYFAVIYLDGFVGTIVANNWVFFLLLFVVLLFLKIISYKISKNFVVRTLFKTIIVTGIAYFFLFVLKFDAVVYSIIGAIAHYFGAEENAFVELAQNARYYEVVENHWFYNLFITFTDKIIEFAKWSFGNVLALDNSCFSVTAETLDIFKIIYTVLAYIVLGGFSVLGTALFAVLLLAGTAVGVYFPYGVGFGLTNLCNKLIYKYRFREEYQSFISRHISPKFFVRKTKDDDFEEFF